MEIYPKTSSMRMQKRIANVHAYCEEKNRISECVRARSQSDRNTFIFFSYSLLYYCAFFLLILIALALALALFPRGRGRDSSVFCVSCAFRVIGSVCLSSVRGKMVHVRSALSTCWLRHGSVQTSTHSYTPTEWASKRMSECKADVHKYIDDRKQVVKPFLY